MGRPFDGDGPTLRDTFGKVRRALSAQKTSSLRKALERGADLYFAVRMKPNPLEAAGAFLDLTSIASDLLMPDRPMNKKVLSETQFKFETLVKTGFCLLEQDTAEIVLPLLDMEKSLLVCRDDDEDPSSRSLWKHEYAEGKFFYWLESQDSISDLVMPETHILDRPEILATFRELLWEPHGNHIEVNYDDQERRISFSEKAEVPWRYEGDQGDRLIERWRKFADAGIRRSVILHGPPGTGKSTLAQQAGRELEGRVCSISVQILSRVSIHTLLEVLETLRPDIFIVDDLDRMGERDLAFFLGFFEESENHIPLLIATTNHLEHLPDALKRPGRFDEIWAVDPPQGEIRIRVIKYLAELEGVELSEEGAAKLWEVSEERNLPGAHLRELLRRIAVMGEDELDFDSTDLTFDEAWREVDPYSKGYKVLKPDGLDIDIFYDMDEYDDEVEDWEFTNMGKGDGR